jgi:hypothetical protein
MGNILTWTGSTSNDWNTDTNWSLVGPPSLELDLIFPDNGSNVNITSTGTKFAKSIQFTTPGIAYTIGGSSVLTLAGDGAITNNSSFDQTFTCSITSSSNSLIFNTTTNHIIINYLASPTSVTKTGIHKLIFGNISYDVTTATNVNEGKLVFTNAKNATGDFNFKDNSSFEVTSGNLSINGSLNMGDNGIIPTTLTISIFGNISNYITAPSMNFLLSNLELTFTNILTTNSTYRILISPSAPYGIDNFKVNINDPAYIGLTFVKDNTQWYSPNQINNQYFLFDSNVGNLYVMPYSCSMNLTSSLNPVFKDTNVTFSAQLISPIDWYSTSTFETFTGNVTFTDNGNFISNVLVSNRFANLTISSLTPGIHTIAATYNGHKLYLSSTTSIQQEIIQSGVNIANISDWIQYIGDTTQQDYHLISDIFFYSSFPGNLSIQPFSTFDGKNNCIYLKNINSFNGLFNLNNCNINSKIKNLRVMAKNVNLNDFNGFLAEGSNNGSKIANGTIENVKVNLKEFNMGNNCGGLIGSYGNNIIIRKSYVSGETNGLNSGGLVGNNCSNINIYNSYVIGKTNNNVGCLIGNNNLIDTVKNTYHAGISTNNLILSGSIINNQTNLYRANIIVL